MKKKRSQTEVNRIEILRKCYELLSRQSWDSLSVTELEKHIDKTRGAIFYFNKNKEDLFINMIDELFFPIFTLDEREISKFKDCSAKVLFAFYKTPFERVCDDLRINYRSETPAFGFFNIFTQCQQYYPDFKAKIQEAMDKEKEFLNGILGSNNSFRIDVEALMTESVGRLFMESIL